MHRTIVIAAAGMLLVPQLATATDVENELRDMQERMDRMEAQLEATNHELETAQETVEKQQAVIEESGLDDERSVMSSLSSFLESTDFNGWVAASYHYKANSTNNSNQNPQGKSTWAPGYTNGNNFGLDQLWFSMDKAPTEESRAGFHADLVYGNVLNNVGDSPIYSAYASYLAPLGSGLQIDGGVMPTLIGFEVLQLTGNNNITRGIVWGLQPVNVTGVSASYGITDGISITARLVNENLTPTIDDSNRGKSFEGQIAWSGEKFGAYLNGGYGRSEVVIGNASTSLAAACAAAGGAANCANVFASVDQSAPLNTVGLLNLVLTADPLDNLTAWIDVLWRTNDVRVNFDNSFTGGAPNSRLTTKVDDIGISAGARIGVLERTGFTVRGEWVRNDIRDFQVVNNGAITPTASAAADFWTVTGTIDQGLTDNLELNMEYRYDGASPGVLPGPTGAFNTPQNHGFLIQMLYEF